MTGTLPPLRPVDLAAQEPLAAYLRAMAPVCPFVEPAAAAGRLFASDVTPDCQEGRDVHPRLFEHLVPQVERFRDARRALPDPRQKLLVCHTVLIHLRPGLDAEAARLLGWPNLLGWSLKQLYTSKEVVLGFVRKGVAERSMAGVPVPVAPFHAVIIRSRVAASDGRFYPGNDAMRRAMMQADDDGQDVHAALFGRVPDVRDPQAMRDDGYYDRVLRAWAKVAPRK